MANHFQSLVGKHEYHRETHGEWMYRPKGGQWTQFDDDSHFANTVDYDHDTQIAFFSQVPNMPLPAAIFQG